MADNYLFKLTNDIGVAGVPTNLRANSAPSLVPSGNGVVDVLGTFPWTNTNGDARQDVPGIVLKEYNVTRSSLFQQARYLLSATPDVVGALETVTKEIGTRNSLIVGGLAGLAAAGPGKRIAGAGTGLLAAAAVSSGLAKDLSNGLTAAAGDLLLQPNTKLKPYLQPYDGLYATKPTGFQYVLPYFNEVWKENLEEWDALNGQTYNKFDSALKDMGEFYNEGGLGGFTGAGALRSFFPAAYIESPKNFRFADGSAERVSVRFTLYNTTTFADVVRNWQFCFLMMYQNRPNRASRVLVDVPSIYEIAVPGIFYYPFAFISAIRIGQLGGTRQMAIPIMTTNSGDFVPHTVQTPNGPKQVQTRPLGGTTENVSIADLNTIIPDAYDVEIQFTPLVTETKNLLYHTLTTNSGIYDVSTVQPGQSKTGSATGVTGGGNPAVVNGPPFTVPISQVNANSVPASVTSPASKPVVPLVPGPFQLLSQPTNPID